MGLVVIGNLRLKDPETFFVVEHSAAYVVAAELEDCMSSEKPSSCLYLIYL